MVLFAVGVFVWAWSVVLILTKVPDGEFVTIGPYALVTHPLYTWVALLVLHGPDSYSTWLRVVIGLTQYAGSRMLAPREEAVLVESVRPTVGGVLFARRSSGSDA